jgi:hypothetical protein
MAEIEQQLRTAMHAAVDGAETAPETLIREVMRRHRRHSVRAVVAAILTALAVAAPVATALEGGFADSGPPSKHVTPPPNHSRMTGLPAPVGTSFRFIVTTPHGAGWYSTATRRIEAIRGLPSVQGGYRFSRADGGWFLTSNQDSSPCAENACAGGSGAQYFIADGAHVATRIGKAWSVGVANQSGAVWLVNYPHVRSGFNVSPSVQLVSTSGTPLSRRYRMPPELLVDRAVGSYLLLGDSPWVHFELWDPRTGHVIQRFTHVLAAGPEQVAWDRGCTHCSVLVTNIATGHTTTVRSEYPAPNTGGMLQEPGNFGATFSDDGQLLAVQDSGGLLVVINTFTGAVTRIPGSALSSADWQNIYWQGAGHRLVITGGSQQPQGPQQIAYWQPGDARLYVTNITSAAELPEIQTGSAG